MLSNQGSLGSASAVSLAAESEFRSEAAVSAPPCGLGASGALVPSFSSWGVGAQANEKGSNKIQETSGWNDSSPGSALKKAPSFSWAKKFSLEGGKVSLRTCRFNCKVISCFTAVFNRMVKDGDCKNAFFGARCS